MIYFDNAATSRPHKEVIDTVAQSMYDNYGNASSKYGLGRGAEKAVSDARAEIARVLGCDDNELYFTSGGTESDNWAIKAIDYPDDRKNIIISNAEHHAVMHTAEYMRKQGHTVTYVPISSEGYVTPSALRAIITPQTALVSCIFANNEIGTISPVKELAEIAHENGALFHTDAVSAFGSIPISCNELGVDLLSVSAHKIHGPKGIGALYVRRGTKINSLLHGGPHERGKRAGTESIPLIAGFAKACELIDIDKKTSIVKPLRDKIIREVLKIPHTQLNGNIENRLPGSANFSFKFIEGEALLLLLDLKGIYVSSGSACTSGSLDPSHVLLALGLPHETAHGSLRITLSEYNTEDEADKFLVVLPGVVDRLRQMSPLYEN